MQIIPNTYIVLRAEKYKQLNRERYPNLKKRAF
jgi:hypothetical protein